MGRSTHKARTVHYIGSISHNRVHQYWVLLRVVFEIGILYNDDIPRCVSKPRSQRRSLSLVEGMINNPIYQQLKLAFQQLSSSIRLEIIDDNNFLIRNRRRLHRIDYRSDRGHFIEARNNYR
jgi:hypothetical protein